LQQDFAALGNRLVGILNGIDARLWDPAHDPCIPARYSVSRLEGKSRCKAVLQQSCGWRDEPRRLLIGMSTRLVEQKGWDIVLAADLLGTTDAQFVVLGSGQPHYHAALRALAAKAPDRVAVQFHFTDAAEHRLLAGADAVLMPSLYEPCGLTQMRAQRYGTVPIARAVGGLRDSIREGQTGLLFNEYSVPALEGTLRRTAQWYEDRVAWRGLVTGAMSQRFGWGEAGEQYLALYRRVVSVRSQLPERAVTK